jgi:flagella basal body P-ring formation protein FlgA
VPAGGVLGPGSLVLRRAVEPGDRVTAIAIAGAVQVSAELEAADGGDPGDVIRVVNRETRRSLRGRVIGDGTVEVGYAR